MTIPIPPSGRHKKLEFVFFFVGDFFLDGIITSKIEGFGFGNLDLGLGRPCDFQLVCKEKKKGLLLGNTGAVFGLFFR